MKFILVLYLCSFAAQPVCDNGAIIGEYNDWFDCAAAGYKNSGIAFDQFNREEINQYKSAIRFECRELGGNI